MGTLVSAQRREEACRSPPAFDCWSTVMVQSRRLEKMVAERGALAVGRGGALLLEAPEVRIRAGRPPFAFRRISVEGGRGSQGSGGADGGGGGRIDSGVGADGEDDANGAGGGGGVGMIRINAIGATRFDYEGRLTGVWDQTMSVGEVLISSPSL